MSRHHSHQRLPACNGEPPVPRLLVLADFYYPASKAGGPPRSIRSALLKSTGLRPVVICRNHDHLSTEPFRAPSQGRTRVDGLDVSYQAKGPHHLPSWIAEIAAELRRADALWINSLHSIRFSVLPILVRAVVARDVPVLWSPRGELAKSALTRHTFRKTLWRRFLIGTGLAKRSLWIASGPNEKTDIQREFPRSNVFTLPGTSLLTGSVLEFKALRVPLRLLFLGRIAPIKGIDDGLRVLAQTTTPIHLTIAGPVEDVRYRQRLEDLAQGLPETVTVEWAGSLTQQSATAAIRECDALFFPTKGENFGHAIAETFSLGRPVIAPLTTPWSFAVDCGALIPLDVARPDVAARAIDNFAVQQPDQIRQKQEAAHRVATVGLPGDGGLDEAVKLAQQLCGRHASSGRKQQPDITDTL